MYSKGIREYLEACRIVKAKHPEVRCMLLGACEGIQDSISPEALKEYTDSGIIEHFGETDTVADYYKQCWKTLFKTGINVNICLLSHL
mgnify:CR=1 FL=1